MKSYCVAVAWLVGSAVQVVAGNSTAANQSPLPPDTDYTVASAGANHRVWQKTSYELAPDGSLKAKPHFYTELAAGLNYWQNGQWLSSVEAIEPYAEGAVAQQGQHQVIFANNINTTGAIDEQTPDGKRLRSNVLGLAYYDKSSGTEVMIAQVQDSQGELTSANQVLYPNAFQGVDADVLYTYKRGGFEQEVILRAQLPPPESYGLKQATTELEVLTEFVNPPPAQIKNIDSGEQSASGLETDQGISWGGTALSRGRAFSLGGVDQVPVAKAYRNVAGRIVLFEKVRYAKIANYLSTLPELSGLMHPLPKLASGQLFLPKCRFAQRTHNPIKYAASDWSKRGYVLDYVSLNSSYTNFTFLAGCTYYLSGNLNLSGTNVFQGDTVIKFASGASISQLASPLAPRVIFASGPYHPVVFTAKDDNTAGESISGSSGNPSGYYANPALYLPNGGTQQLADYRISYANTGLKVPSTTLTTYDGQFVKCSVGVSLSGSTNLFENVLFSGVTTNFSVGASGAAVVENATFNNAYSLVSPTNSYPAGAWLALTNCAMVNVTNICAGTIGGYNGFYRAPAFGAFQTTNTVNPFTNSLGGNCYLTSGGSFVSAGTTNLVAGAVSLLQAKTVYKPQVFANSTISISTNYSPVVTRDTNASPSLGYHYDPLDYVFAETAVNSNVTFTAGTAVGWYRTSSGWYDAGDGLHLMNQASVNFVGTPTSPCWWVRLNTVQEQDASGGYGPGGLTSWGSGPSTYVATINGVFLKCSELANDAQHFRDDGCCGGGHLVVNAVNSEFYGTGVQGYSLGLNFTNCLFVGTGVGMDNGTANNDLALQNCTFISEDNSSVFANSDGAGWPIYIVNCTFQNCDFNDFVTDASTYIDNNAYLTGDSQLPVSGPDDVLVTNAVGYGWETGLLGNYYLPTNSPLLQAGSTYASVLGLYYFTTQTNQIIQSNAIVDIGYHYVAVPPVLSLVPITQVAELGGNVSFQAGSQYAGTIYQWYFVGGGLLSGATNATLSITNVQVSNLGFYDVVASNIFGCVTSPAAALDLMTAEGTNESLIWGQSATFGSGLSGPDLTSYLTYQWLYDGIPLEVGTNNINLITTVAGNYNYGGSYSGDGYAATNAALNWPRDVVVDGSGNLYIADTANSVIREVDTNGNITTIAGNYSYGGSYSGDGDLATNAALNWPQGIVLDSAGNLYIADTGNNVIRKVSAVNGDITTIAGNNSIGGGYSGDGAQATNAALNSPTVMAVDSSGNIYFADSGNSVIRMISLNGNITTVAGNYALRGNYSGDGFAATNAALNNPTGIAVDGCGNLYIADTGNSVIRGVDTNGIITTIAGNYILGANYTGDNGLATGATLNNPSGVAVDGSGNLYIADANNSVVREVDTNGYITTVAGNYSLGWNYSGDGGLATNAALSDPAVIALDSSGDLFIDDSDNEVIREVTFHQIDVSNAGATLTLSGLNLGASGNYQAVVSNPYASLTNSINTLSVSLSPYGLGGSDVFEVFTPLQ